jgi:hypothetical protein
VLGRPLAIGSVTMRRFIVLCTLVAASVTAYATDAAAAPLKCVSNDINTAPVAVSGSVLLNDPVQKGHFYGIAPGAASTCAAAKAAPAVAEGTADYHFKSHVFKNRSATASCVEVRYTFTGGGAHEVTAYAGSFDPNNIGANYLGDSGSGAAGADTRAFSVTVPAMSDIVLVATWSGVAAAGSEPAYDLSVAGCGQMVVTGIAPASGPVTGGTAVEIKGSGFEGATAAVTIGVAATNVQVMNDDMLVATTAANAAGTYDVTVTSGALVSTLAQAYTYGAAPVADAGTDAATDAGVDAGREAGAGGPTTGGPTSGSSSSSSGGTTPASDSGTNNAGEEDEDDDQGDASTGDGGTKRVSGTKKKTPATEEYVCACNEIGRSTTPGLGAFATMALGVLAVLRLRKRR